MSVGNKFGDRPLHRAALYGNLEVAKVLMEVPGNFSTAVNNKKETPLLLATRENHGAVKELLAG